MSQVNVLKRAIIVIAIAGAAATVLAPHSAPAGAFHAVDPTRGLVDLGPVAPEAPTPTLTLRKSPLRVPPIAAEAAPTALVVVQGPARA